MTTSLAIDAALPATLAEAHAEIRALRAALAEQQALARIPLQNPNPIYRLGPNQQRLFANPAAEQLAAELKGAEVTAGRAQAFGWAMEALGGVLI